MGIIRLVHVSDFHLKNDLLTSDHRVVKPLKDDLLRFHKERPIEVIVCSGDLIDQGGQSFDNPNAAFDAFADRVVDPLLEHLGIDRSQFVIAPGNHDAVRSKDSEYIDRGLFESLSTVDAVDRFLEEDDPEGVKRMIAFESFRDRFYSNSDQPVKVGSRFAQYLYNVGSRSLGIVALDSAWRCYGGKEKDNGNLLIGQKSVIGGLEGIETCELLMAVYHHPLGYLAPFDRETVEPIIEREFDLALSGHTHSGDTVSIDRATGLLCISTAPGVLNENSLSKDTRYQNGYRVIDVDLNERTITSHDRIYIPEKNCFTRSNSGKSEDGTSVFNLPTTIEVSQRRREREIVRDIGSRFDETLNEHLLTYGTNTCAPKTVRELFVIPEIVSRDAGQVDSIDDIDEESISETTLDTDSILSKRENLILCGAKEIGKTVLLDRLFTIMVDEVSKRRMVPVRIEWSKLGNRYFKSEVNVKTGVGSTGVSDLCTDHDVVLLIDDITFEEEDIQRLRKLKDFVLKYPRVRVIATHLQENSSEVPVGLLPHNNVLELFPVEIRTFGVRQIRELIERWFNGSKANDIASDIDRLVTLFQTLNLPSNPLAVSIFLWMIEKQEQYEPTNGSTMMENFIERLFQKHSANEALSGQFDTHNKQRLLAEIAQHMYGQDNPDYRVPYSELLNIVRESLKAKKFEFVPREILKRFIEMGLFSTQGQNIQFRFRCFFEYFLAKRMQYEEQFEKRVLRDKLLVFSSEIRYLTGLQRDRTDILSTVLDRMESEFQQVRTRLAELGTYDDAFASARSFLGQTDADRILGSVEQARPTEEELDDRQDMRLGMMASTHGISQKEEPATMFGRLSRILSLAAGVLKNTEETTKTDVKVEAYRRILACALVYTVLYKYELIKYLTEERDSIPSGFASIVQWVADFAPVITQLTLHHELSTPKLRGVFREEIDRVLSNDSTTELERFISVFLYADSRGPGYLKYVKELINVVELPDIQTNVFIKVISYYYVRSRNQETDNKLLSLMGDLIVKAKGLQPSDKGMIMQKHRRAKTRLKAKGDQQQRTLAL